MATNDNNLESRTNRWMVAGVVLMLIGLLAFPIYRINEPTTRAEAAEQTQSNLALAGESLWSATCASCHGAYGQGVDAPALNSIQFLTIATDEQILTLASAGIPGSGMSAYGQQFGGPLTQEQLVSIVACIRSWESTAPDRPDWRDIPADGAGHDDGDGHDDLPADGDGGHDDGGEVVTTEGPPGCGPNYDPALFEDHEEDDDADGDGHDEDDDDHAEDTTDANDHEEDGDADGDGHDEDGDDHADDTAEVDEEPTEGHGHEEGTPEHDD